MAWLNSFQYGNHPSGLKETWDRSIDAQEASDLAFKKLRRHFNAVRIRKGVARINGVAELRQEVQVCKGEEEERQGAES